MVRMLGAVVLCAAAALVPNAAAAQALSGQIWQPNKPIAIVIPFPPGPGLDLVARMVGDKLSASIGQPVVYENRTGASGSIAAEYVARAVPDGTTLMAAATSTHATNVHLIKNLSYDPVKNFTPIVESVETIGCIVVNTSVVPVNSVAELVAYAKANPGKLNYASAGAGTSHHLAGELFKQQTGTFITHIPYRGAGPALQDLIAGNVDCMFDGLGSSAQHIKAGRIKALMVAGKTRNAAFPDVPCAAEVGLPDYTVTTWYGLWTPKGTPADVQAKIVEDVNKSMQADDIKSVWASNGSEIPTLTPAQFGAFVSSEVKRWAVVVKSAGAKLD